MTNSFSERQGIYMPQKLRVDEISEGLRNRLWNSTEEYFKGMMRSQENDILKTIWDRFFKQSISILKYVHTFDGLEDIYQSTQIRHEFYLLDWNRVYDLLEFILSFDYYQKAGYISSINNIFSDELVQYKIIDCKVTPLISDEECDEISKAINTKFTLVNNHIKKALELYRKRPNADYKNSIKESISSIEALSRIILKNPKATLGELIKKMELHQAFKSAISSLYGWTSDEGGIRHSENGQELNTDEEEARFMLVQCSALVNYIISKNEV